MYQKKKERLYISDLLGNPAVPYPSYYVLSTSMHKNEMLQSAIIALHNFDFSYYETARGYEGLFNILCQHRIILKLYHNSNASSSRPSKWMAS